MSGCGQTGGVPWRGTEDRERGIDNAVSRVS